MSAPDDMTPEEAKRVILANVMPDEGTGEPQSFLGALRPYRRMLPRRQFHDLMAAVRTLGRTWARDPQIDREVISALWSLTELTRLWALDEEGMLRRNHLITDPDLALLRRWNEMLSYAVMTLLEAENEQEAFFEYDRYVREDG